ncbi:MAG: hypothetical protein [Wendovervirus sonii]|uniref:Uncharacterized protein n=1 Tax=phage Lak_Megaphage_Sonny TaxID=3109229 RepID=A0ABZ0Z6X9_9CAUD|nr:MAG: hypothetical protein [phage Lak_Megaphage_Sonny]
MKYLYNKIYEAINTGISKALVLDDEDDISMNYQHKKIVNNANLMPYYVDELLNDISNYKQLIKYYKNSGYTYKVKDFNELRNIFDKIKNIKNASFEWIENMKDYISIVLEDDTEINFYEKSDKTPLFLKFANDDILGTENEILIYIHDNHKICKKKLIWQDVDTLTRMKNSKYFINDEIYKTYVDAKNIANKNYSGYKNSIRIYDENSSGNSAINYCLNQNVNNYQGYLPSLGQLKIMSDNIDMINYVFKYLKLKKIIILNDEWWSSTEYNDYIIWDCFKGIQTVSNKRMCHLVIPFFFKK